MVYIYSAMENFQSVIVLELWSCPVAGTSCDMVFELIETREIFCASLLQHGKWVQGSIRLNELSRAITHCTSLSVNANPFRPELGTPKED
jgi:hypothetical protein